MSNLQLPSLDNYDKTLKVAYNLVHKNASSSFGKEIYVDIDYRKEFNNFIFDVKERNNDYWFSYKYNIVRDLQLQIPTGYQVTAVPANVSIKNSDYEIDATITTATRQNTCTRKRSSSKTPDCRKPNSSNGMRTSIN